MVPALAAVRAREQQLAQGRTRVPARLQVPPPQEPVLVLVPTQIRARVLIHPHPAQLALTREELLPVQQQQLMPVAFQSQLVAP